MGFIAGFLVGVLVSLILLVPLGIHQTRKINELLDHSEDTYDTRGKYN